MKVIALKVINKTQPGGELDLPDNVAKVLVLLGNARYADGSTPEGAAPKPEQPKAISRRRTVSSGAPIGVMTRGDAPIPDAAE